MIEGALEPLYLLCEYIGFTYPLNPLAFLASVYVNAEFALSAFISSASAPILCISDTCILTYVEFLSQITALRN